MHKPSIIQQLNQFVNVFWSVFAFVPIIWLWTMFIVFLGIAVAWLLILNKLLEKARNGNLEIADWKFQLSG